MKESTKRDITTVLALFIVWVIAIAVAPFAEAGQRTYSYQQYVECRQKAVRQIKRGATNSETVYCIPPKRFFYPKPKPKTQRRVGRAN